MIINEQIITLGFGPRVTTMTVDQFLQLNTVGAGWTDLLLELFEKLFDLGWDGKVQQCKEKFGSLRFYLATDRQDLFDVAAHYEQQSVNFCEFCGSFPSKTRMNRSWIKTMCDDCYQQDLTSNSTSFKNL